MTINTLNTQVDKLNDTVYGNGKEGLTTKIGKLSVLTKIVLTLQVSQFAAFIGWVIKNVS